MTTESTLSTLSGIHISQRTCHNLLVIMLPWRSENHILVGWCNFYLCVADLFYLTKSPGLFAMSQIISILKTILFICIYIYISYYWYIVNGSLVRLYIFVVMSVNFHLFILLYSFLYNPFISLLSMCSMPMSNQFFLTVLSFCVINQYIRVCLISMTVCTPGMLTILLKFLYFIVVS